MYPLDTPEDIEHLIFKVTNPQKILTDELRRQISDFLQSKKPQNDQHTSKLTEE
jgi:hypothetical protein